MFERKVKKLIRDPDHFFEDLFAKRRKRRRALRAARRMRLEAILRPFAALSKRFEREVDESLILYESFHGRSMSCNPYAIFRYLVADPRFAHYRHAWVVEDPALHRDKVAGLRGVELVRKDSGRHRKLLASAKYLINNNTFLPYFSKREGQVYVNTQHGVPIKTMGKDIRYRFGMGANVTRNFLQADFLVFPNRYTTEVMLRSHDVENLFEGQIIETGYPRSDLTTDDPVVQRTLRDRLRIQPGKKVLLYAPTHRVERNGPSEREEEIADFVRTLQRRYGDEYTIIYKAHHIDRSIGESIRQDVGNLDPNELLSVVDVLITDYSSIAFDFFRQRKPILYFAHDLEEYQAARGLYLDLEELPGQVCRDRSEVLEQLDALDGFVEARADQYDRGIERFCALEDGRVTERVVETIFLGRPCSEVRRLAPSEKKRILIYGGGFLNNGVTSSVSSLMKSLDPEEYEIYLAFNRAASSENIARLKARAPESIKVLFYLKPGRQDLATIDVGEEEHARSEAYRLFGDAKFDIAIDASGYGRLWPAVMAQVHAERRYIFLHNIMKKEQELRPQLADYEQLFELYGRAYDGLINVSQSAFEANSQDLPHLRHKMVCLENILDVDRIERLANETELDPSKINFINIGRYTYQKGQDRLLTAFASVHRRYPDARLHLVGHGPTHRALERQIQELGLTGEVFLTGKMENPFRLLKQCDCFVMSSRYEGQGLVLLEALTLGVPALSTDIPGPRSILDPDLLYEDSEAGLVQGMLDFIEGRLAKQDFEPTAYNAAARRKLHAILNGTPAATQGAPKGDAKPADLRA